MDPKLAEIYGTNQATEADVEKLAAAELATKLAGDESVDINQMTEEDLEAVAQQILANGTQEPEAETEKTSEAEETEQVETDDAQEKVAEADYLGRVMAHAYVQELRDIEKTAGVKEMAGKAAGKVGKHLESVGKKAFGTVMRTGGAEGKMDPKTAKRIGAGVYGAGATAAAGAAYGAKKAFGGKGKEKKSAAEELSAVDTLVLARANEILAASGINPDELTAVEQEKTSADETVDAREVLAATVEQRAWELLGQYGVVPAETEQVEAETQE